LAHENLTAAVSQSPFWTSLAKESMKAPAPAPMSNRSWMLVVMAEVVRLSSWHGGKNNKLKAKNHSGSENWFDDLNLLISDFETWVFSSADLPEIGWTESGFEQSQDALDWHVRSFLGPEVRNIYTMQKLLRMFLSWHHLWHMLGLSMARAASQTRLGGRDNSVSGFLFNLGWCFSVLARPVAKSKQ